MIKPITLLSFAAFTCSATAFSPSSGFSVGTSRTTCPLFMGRAAAVRAQTKGKTDMKKAKCNATFGKKIIMAVKQGGSPSTDANRALADVIKQAKANNVPADVSVVIRD
jgi:transcriptional/translational regulatory protein YebC/TACO1